MKKIKRIKRCNKYANSPNKNYGITDSISPMKSEFDSFRYCEYNAEISNKFYKFLDLGLNLKFEVYEEKDKIILTLNIPCVTSKSGYVNSDENIYFYINKDSFKIHKNHMEVCGYMDPYIYDLYKDKIKLFYEKRSYEIFHKTINEILDSFPSIGREFKIDEIFND